MNMKMMTVIASIGLFLSTIAFAGTSTLSWTNPTLNTDGSALTLASINIYRATNATGPWVKIGSVTQTGTPLGPTSYVDATAVDGITDYYTVTAVGTDGAESVQSLVVSKAMPAATPNCPTGLTVK